MNLIGDAPASEDFVPLPPRQINALNQADLEASELGTNLEIPDGASLTIVIDDSFTMTKPFKIGLGSAFEIYASTTNTSLTYTGLGALFQNTDNANLINNFRASEIFLTGDGTNNLFDLHGTGLFVISTSQITAFDDVGTVEMANIDIRIFIEVAIIKGIKFLNPATIVLDSCLIAPTTPSTGITAFSIITTSTFSLSTRNVVVAAAFSVGDSLFFVDPNTPDSSLVAIESSNQGPGELFQLGSDITIDSVADNGSGNAQFTTAAVHGLRVGTPVVLSAFATETTYNGTFIVTAIPTTTTFDVEEVFTATDTGNVNASSFDQTDNVVLASNNTGSQDSMYIGGWFHTTNVALTPVVDGTFGPLNLSTGGGVTVFIENERFNVTILTDGTVEYTGLEPKTVSLITVLSISKTGSTSNYNLRYAISRDTGAFVALPTPIERAQSISSTSRDTTLNQEVVLNKGDRIRVEIEGVGTTDSVMVDFGSQDIKG